MTGITPERLDLIRQRLDETGYAEWKHAARDLLAEVDRLHECYAREDATAHDRAERAEAERDEAREMARTWRERYEALREWLTEERATFWGHDTGTGRLRRSSVGTPHRRLVGPWEPDEGDGNRFEAEGS